MARLKLWLCSHPPDDQVNLCIKQARHACQVHEQDQRQKCMNQKEDSFRRSIKKLRPVAENIELFEA